MGSKIRTVTRLRYRLNLAINSCRLCDERSTNHYHYLDLVREYSTELKKKGFDTQDPLLTDIIGRN